LNQPSREHLWVQAQEDAKLYIFSRSEAGIPGKVRFHNANVCKLLQYFSPSKNRKTASAVYFKTPAVLKHSLDPSTNSPSDILPFNRILGERQTEHQLQLRPNQKASSSLLGSVFTSPEGGEP